MTKPELGGVTVPQKSMGPFFKKKKGGQCFSNIRKLICNKECNLNFLKKNLRHKICVNMQFYTR